MIYLLLFILLCFLFLSYYSTGRDFFTPATVQVMAFCFSVSMCVYWMWFIGVPHAFHWSTISIMASGLGLSVGLGITVHKLFNKIRINRDEDYCGASPITGAARMLTICFILVIISWQLAEIVRITGAQGSFNEVMKVFRSRNSWSADESYSLPLVLRQCMTLIQALFMVYGFNFICFFRKLSIKDKAADIVVMTLCAASSLLTGGRGGTVNNLIGLAVIFHLLRIRQLHGFPAWQWKTVARVALCFFLMLYGFVLANRFIGRIGGSATLPPLSYIALYTGGEPIVLDQYLQNPPPPSDIIGKYTFYAMIRNLQNLGIISHPRYIIHLDIRAIGGGYNSNVYSFFGVYHHDFGLLGTYVLHGLMITTMSLLYEYAKKRLSDKLILILGSIYYCVALSFFADRFYSNFLSFSFLLKLSEIYLLYEILLKKKFKFVLKISS